MEGGTTFCPSPTPKEIKCLHRFITRRELHSGICVADVYSAAPNDLVAQHAQPASSGTGDGGGGHGGAYYFLSSVHGVSETSKRKSRAVNCTNGKQGRWHTETGRKRVEGTAGGYMSNFSYQEKTASGTTRPGWLMVEYSIDRCDKFVIAKIYRSPRHQATNKILQEMERKLMSDDDAGGAVDLVESLQAELTIVANLDFDADLYNHCCRNVHQ